MAFKMKGSPFKMDDGPGKGGKKKNIKKATVNAARQLLKEKGIDNNFYIGRFPTLSKNTGGYFANGYFQV